MRAQPLVIPSRAFDASPRRRVTAIAAAVLVLALVAGGVAAISLSTRHDGAARPIANRAPAGATSQRRRDAARAIDHPHRATPALATVVRATSFDGTTAHYAITGSGAPLVITTATRCWLQLRTADQGTIVLEATLAPGESRTIPIAPPLWLRLGNPTGARIALGTLVIQLPDASRAGAPINVDVTKA